MTEEEILLVIERKLKSLSNSFDDDDYADAVDDAERETGFSFPTDSTFQIKWLMERTIRHLFASIGFEAASKFKVKAFNLNQRYEQYADVIKRLDREFAQAQRDNTWEFAQVSQTQLFGHKIDAGFSYEEDTGVETTYDEDQLLLVTPSDDD